MTQSPETRVGEIAAMAMALVFLGRMFLRVRKIPVSPDPWGEEVEKQMQSPEAVEVCHRCFTPVSSNGWFCEDCGCAVGPYNNLMPYINIFSQAEVLRNGVNDRFPRNPLIVAGYLIYSLNLAVLAPFFWISFFKNLQRKEEVPNDPPAP